MKLCSCIPILNTNVVKFKEIENVEKKIAKFYLQYVVKFKETENVEKKGCQILPELGGE